MNEQTEQQNDSVLNQILHDTAKYVKSRVKQYPEAITIRVLATGIHAKKENNDVAVTVFGSANDAFMDKKNTRFHMLDMMFTEELRAFATAFFSGPAYKLLKHITGIAGTAFALFNAGNNTTEDTESTEDKE